MLREGRRPAGQIAQRFEISRPAVSKHLRLLRDANLVSEHRRGRERWYELNPLPLKHVERWLVHYRTFWQRRLSDLKTFVETEEK